MQGGKLFQKNLRIQQIKTNKGKQYVLQFQPQRKNCPNFTDFIAIFEKELTSSNELTLRKMQLWMQQPSERLKWLATVCESVQGMFGFQIISQISVYEMQGNTHVQLLMQRILQKVYEPFLKYISLWIYQGELCDNYKEFFVGINQQQENNNNNDIWKNKYFLVIQQIPNIIVRESAQIIFNLGRSINFLHKACKQNDWKLNLEFFNFKVEKNADQLKSWLRDASRLVNNQIMDVLVNKYHLKKHLYAIKQFLLMGQGDFIQQLMHLLYDELSQPANQIFRHNLLGQLESAIRSSNANSETSQRLDVKLLEASPGDKGWDIFSLDYHVEAPLDTILSKEVMRKYLKIFNFLWRMRRISHTLSQVWLSHMKAGNIMNQKENIGSLYAKINRTRHEMINFINNFMCYIMVDAIESSWKEFCEEFDKSEDFQTIIDKHEEFVQNVLTKSLLTQDSLKIYEKINKIATLILKFRINQQVLITEVQDEHERIRQFKVEQRAKLIINQLEEEQDADFKDNNLENSDFQIPQSANNFKEFNKEYQQAFAQLLQLIKHNDKLRYLSFKIDFNEYYAQENFVILNTKQQQTRLKQNDFQQEFQIGRNQQQQQFFMQQQKNDFQTINKSKNNFDINN
ncbi:hypothetical protein IMG5_022900 [Ichthyophthirius multifiliis]|uniref:Spindle pole body component n=1 Tax=Ichthyophthirius multifiliis TaxID=5932 RepID=G0QKW3_ICHMU|nr:hypothetical protein IMG5_022900 [Ichthyophthirius multifiliis]EGR34147.1 hypothetical protein IMG5_022900 [Ichthyophthirius multifiliis]|eukprot:XP_004039451.1 hypothetical protein IMG5_022900 [Ichthyophthirius multifiliis]